MTSEVLDVVVNVLGLDGTARGREWDFKCPSHDDSRASAGINLETGLWHCFSCGAGGDLAGLAAAVRHVDRATATKIIEPNTPEALLSTLKRSINSHFVKKRDTKARISLPASYPPEPMTYLRQRGFKRETLRIYGAGYVERERFERQGGAYTIRDYVGLPIRDRHGHLMAWCYRATRGGPRYLYTPGAELAHLWFGAQLFGESDDIIITEGALDSMWVAQAGLPAYGMLGVSMVSALKIRHLLRHKRVILFLDKDAAGAQRTKHLGDQLFKRVPTLVVRYPKGVPAKDPQELTQEQVLRAVERAIPYQIWAS